jgi:hypothetical protein
MKSRKCARNSMRAPGQTELLLSSEVASHTAIRHRTALIRVVRCWTSATICSNIFTNSIGCVVIVVEGQWRLGEPGGSKKKTLVAFAVLTILFGTTASAAAHFNATVYPGAASDAAAKGYLRVIRPGVDQADPGNVQRRGRQRDVLLPYGR